MSEDIKKDLTVLIPAAGIIKKKGKGFVNLIFIHSYFFLIINNF